MKFVSKYNQLKLQVVKNIQTTTPGFVLTSLSFKTAERNNKIPKYNQQYEAPHKSCITKFDYCLPPEEINIPAENGYSLHQR